MLHEAAEHGGPFVFMAGIVFCEAVHGETLPPIEARPPLVKAEGIGDAFARADKSGSVNLSVYRVNFRALDRRDLGGVSPIMRRCVPAENLD